MFRHAGAESGADKPDHERRLTPEGEASARSIGAALRRVDEVPDVAYCSAVDRARATLEIAAASGAWTTQTTFQEALYITTVEATLDVIAQAPNVERVMVVGHNPTWGELVAELTGEAVRLRPATVVGIDLAIGDWADVTFAQGDIAYVLRPDDTSGTVD